MVIELGKGAFDLGEYNSTRRSQQIATRGLLHCEPWVHKLAGLQTSLRFKHSMVMMAVSYGIRHSPETIPTGKFTIASFSRATAFQINVMLSHCRTLVLAKGRFAKALEQLAKADHPKFEALANFISTAIKANQTKCWRPTSPKYLSHHSQIKRIAPRMMLIVLLGNMSVESVVL